VQTLLRLADVNLVEIAGGDWEVRLQEGKHPVRSIVPPFVPY
jgi:hypothetical protein